MNISIDSIKQGEYQVWSAMSKETMRNLVEDIRENGQTYPILVDESFTILDGHHRYLACKEIGLTEINVRVYHGLSHEEKLAMAYRVNATKRTITRAEKQQKAKVLRAEGRSYRQIAKWLGVSKSTVERWLASGVPNGTSVKGRDGKTYASTSSKTAEYLATIKRLEAKIEELHAVNETLTLENLELQLDRNGSVLDNGLKVFAHFVGLNEGANVADIMKSFRVARGKAHPDTFDATWISQRYNPAYKLFEKLYLTKGAS